MALVIRRLTHKDSIGDFGCGSKSLDDYLKNVARRNSQRQWSVTWIACEEDRVAGYVTLVSAALAETIAKKVDARVPDRAIVPALLLARMGTDLRFKGRHVGTRLMREVFVAAIAQAGLAGSIGVYTDAEEDAVEFYARFGFARHEEPASTGGTTLMVLPLAEVRRRLGEVEAALAALDAI